MNDAFKAAIKEAWASCTHEIPLDTIEIYHPKLAYRFYYVKDRADFAAKLEDGTDVVFARADFVIKLPERSDGGLQDLELRACNVDRALSDFFAQASEVSNLATDKARCVWRPYLASDPSGPQMTPPLRLTLSDIKATLYEVSARASFADLINRNFPGEVYSRATFPGLG